MRLANAFHGWFPSIRIPFLLTIFLLGAYVPQSSASAEPFAGSVERAEADFTISKRKGHVNVRVEAERVTDLADEASTLLITIEDCGEASCKTPVTFKKDLDAQSFEFARSSMGGATVGIASLKTRFAGRAIYLAWAWIGNRYADHDLPNSVSVGSADLAAKLMGVLLGIDCLSTDNTGQVFDIEHEMNLDREEPIGQPEPNSKKLRNLMRGSRACRQ